jgi:hypothetical protein
LETIVSDGGNDMDRAAVKDALITITAVFWAVALGSIAVRLLGGCYAGEPPMPDSGEWITLPSNDGGASMDGGAE